LSATAITCTSRAAKRASRGSTTSASVSFARCRPATARASRRQGFITQLSSKLAADVLNERLTQGVARKAAANLLVSSQHGKNVLRRVSSDKYEQVFDHDIALRVAELCKRGTWGKAEAFKRAAGEPARHARGEQPALPLGWVGDRNMFVLLVDYDRPIVIGEATYARFFMLSHSEVGAGALNVTFGLLDFVCCNMILWGCTEVYEASFRHTKSIHDSLGALSGGLSKSLSAENHDTMRMVSRLLASTSSEAHATKL